MLWTSAVSTEPDPSAAVEETVAVLREELAGAPPDLVLAFATRHHRDDGDHIARLVAERFPRCRMMGCVAGGIVGAGREIERGPGISLVAAVLPGVDVRAFHLDSDAIPGWDASLEDWRATMGFEDEPEPHFMVIPDPFTCDATRLVAGLDLAYPSSTKVGGLASGAEEPGQTVLFVDGRTHRSGVVGLGLRGNIEVDTIVAQGCRPIGAPLFSTRSERNVIMELDGRRPSDVLQELYETLDDRDRELMRHALFIGLVMRQSQEVYGQGDFLVRNIIGLDARTGALAVGARVPPHSVVQFQLRDAATSAEELDNLLRAQLERQPQRPSGALLFSCLGRGQGLYGVPDHDSTLLREHLGPIGTGGFFCNGEIGPVQGRTHLHGYTSAFALFRSRQSH